MSKLDWGSSSAHRYEQGVDRGMFYPVDGEGIPWNGLVSVKENISTPAEVIRYYDGKQYRNQISKSDFSATIECYTYPSLLDNYEHINAGLSAGSRRGHTYFNFSYRTMTEKGYQLHLVYNAIATSSSKSYATLGNTTDPINFSWEINTVSVNVPGAKETAHFVVDSTIAHPWTLSSLEDFLYGSVRKPPSFPTVDELIDIFQEGSILRITDHGDGTWSAEGPDEAIKMLNGITFEINWPSAVYLDDHTYRIGSL